MNMRPSKTQISLGIRPVWSESSLCAQWVTKGLSFLHADSKDPDQTGQADQSLRWAHSHFVGFVMRRLTSFDSMYFSFQYKLARAQQNQHKSAVSITWYPVTVLMFWCHTFRLERGVSKKFVHWCYNFLTTKDIEMISSDLLIWCIPSSSELFLCITNLCTFHYGRPGYLWALQKKSALNDTSCSYESYFLDFENGKIHIKRSDFRLQWVKTNFISISAAPLFIQTYIYSARLCHLTLMGRPRRESCSRLSLPSQKRLCLLKINFLLTL